MPSTQSSKEQSSDPVADSSSALTARVENASSSSSSSEDEKADKDSHEAGADIGLSGGYLPPGSSISIKSRGEKKARKALEKVGLIKVEGVLRVTFKRRRDMVFAIQNPDVYKSPNSNSYIIFGEAKAQEIGLPFSTSSSVPGSGAPKGSSAAGANGRGQAGSSAVSNSNLLAGVDKLTGDMLTGLNSLDDEASGGKDGSGGEDSEVDDTGLRARDIELIMSQSKVSRKKAIKALRKHDEDVVNAIMELNS